MTKHSITQTHHDVASQREEFLIREIEQLRAELRQLRELRERLISDEAEKLRIDSRGPYRLLPSSSAFQARDRTPSRKYSLEELREMRERGETETSADAPVYSLEPDFWENARVVMPPGKSEIADQDRETVEKYLDTSEPQKLKG
jgi:hypothetical protein